LFFIEYIVFCSYNDRNAPPDDPDEAPFEADYDESLVPVVLLDPPPAMASLASLIAATATNIPKTMAGAPAMPLAFLSHISQQPLVQQEQQQYQMQQMQQQIQMQPLPVVKPPEPKKDLRLGLCSFYDNGRGQCRFGKQCRFSHEII
jgi:hypothetical protein